MHETPYQDVNKLLESLLSGVRGILGERLVGLYLYGSLTTGDFDHESSDIDLLAALASDVTDDEFEVMHAMHQAFALQHPDWEDRIEVAYVSAQRLNMFRHERGPMAVISPGEPFHIRHQEPLWEWLQNWYLVREYGATLFGPRVGDIIPPIAQEEFAQAVRDYAAEVSDRLENERSPKHRSYAVLTLCRALHVHRKGTQTSKKQAALWTQQEFPEWSRLVQSALDWRKLLSEGQVDHAGTYAETIRFVNFVRDQLLSSVEG